MSRVKIVTYAPLEACDLVRDSLGKAGAGAIGEYTFCSFSTRGQGRSQPSSNASPYYGKVGELSVEEEECIEVVCDKSIAKKAIEAIKKAHPYEEVAFEVIPLLSEEDL